MPIPSSVEIGPWRFRITDDLAEYNASSAKSEAHLWGQIHYGLEEIVINPDQTDGHKRYALLHELLHGVWHSTDVKHEDDEAPIRRMTAGILELLRRNPALVAYLTEE